MLGRTTRGFQDGRRRLHPIALHRCAVPVLALPCLSHHLGLLLQEVQLRIAHGNRCPLRVPELRRVSSLPLSDRVVSVQHRRQGRSRTSGIGCAQVGQSRQSRRDDVHPIDGVCATAGSIVRVIRAGRRIRHVDRELPFALRLSLPVISGRHAGSQAMAVGRNARLGLMRPQLVLTESLRLRRQTGNRL